MSSEYFVRSLLDRLYLNLFIKYNKREKIRGKITKAELKL